MNDVLLATLLGAVVGGLGSLLVPRLIGWIPEPPAEPANDPVDEQADDQADDPQPAKEPYAAIAALPGLRSRSVLAGAAVGALLGGTTGLDWSLTWLLPLVPVAIALSVIDWRTRLLPRVLVRLATLDTLVLVVGVGLATGETTALVRALLGMLLVRSFFWVLWRLRSAGMGFGDVRLAALVGLVLGWVGWGPLAIGVWTGFVVFAVPGLALAISRRDRSLLRRPSPYGPFMLVGAVVGLVWGPAVSESLWG